MNSSPTFFPSVVMNAMRGGRPGAGRATGAFGVNHLESVSIIDVLSTAPLARRSELCRAGTALHSHPSPARYRRREAHTDRPRSAGSPARSFAAGHRQVAKPPDAR